MIGLSLPETGQPFGWSVASEELQAALGKLTGIAVITDEYCESQIVRSLPILHACQGVNLLPLRPQFKSTVRNVGWSFVEDNILVRSYLGNAVNYDHLVCGSTWQADCFRALGLQHISVAIQGVNARLFEIPPRKPDDKFIVFSGGKAEYRKGQDVLIRAMRIFMDLHNDAWLLPAWHNPWGFQIPGYAEIAAAFRDVLDLSRVMMPGLAAVPHQKMGGIYARADVGLFCNRCEAGNNMVMCEFMATGRPVIATYATGHKDVLDVRNPFNLTASKPLTVKGPDGCVTGEWVEPDLDEVLAMLELAYHSRDMLPALGEACKAYVSEFTWECCAREFLKVLEPERLGLDVGA